MLLIGAVVLALGLAGGWFGLRALQGNQREDAIRAVATDFYAALAASDATKAASLSATPLPTSPLLTAKALAASQKSAPISAATVSDIRSSDESPKAVAKVSYQVGEREVTTDMGLTRTGEAWKLDDVWTALVVPTTTGGAGERRSGARLAGRGVSGHLHGHVGVPAGRGDGTAGDGRGAGQRRRPTEREAFAHRCRPQGGRRRHEAAARRMRSPRR